ncbi:MAG: hypothetical protein L0287_04160, partial [Anaerolineae bacterium]|nr:hypothetical protein [Anaerolineae bacterium]
HRVRHLPAGRPGMESGLIYPSSKPSRFRFIGRLGASLRALLVVSMPGNSKSLPREIKMRLP